jgi:hypothetical protein
LNPKDQERALSIDDRGASGLYELEGGFFDDDNRTKPRSVRELQSWIDDHMRFDKAAIDPMLFPETAGVLAKAREATEKVVQITHDYQVHPDARDRKERIYSERSWKRADGHQKSKACDHSITGVVVAGEARGQAFKVCIAKEKCSVHWKTEQAESKRRRASAGKPAAKREDPGAAQARAKKAREQEELDRKLTDETDRRFLTELLGKLKGPLPRVAWLYLAEDSLERNRYDVGNLLDGAFGKDALKKKPAGMKTDELGRLVFGLELAFRLNDGQAPASILHWAKTLKVDRLAIAKAVQSEHAAQEKAARAGQMSVKATPKKKTAKR